MKYINQDQIQLHEYNTIAIETDWYREKLWFGWGVVEVYHSQIWSRWWTAFYSAGWEGQK